MATPQERIAAGQELRKRGKLSPEQDAALAELERRYSAAPAAEQPQRMQPEQAAPKEEGGFERFKRGVTRLPALVGLSDEMSAGEAWSRAGEGAGSSIQAVGTGIIGPVGDAAAAGISELITDDEEGFSSKMARARENRKELAAEKPISNAIGEIYGLGRAGMGARRVSGGRLGIGGEAAAIAGLYSLAEQQDAQTAGQNAILGFVGGKALQGVADKTLVPAAKWVTDRVRPAMRGGTVSPAVINNIASRTDMSPEQITDALDEYIRVNSRAPSLAELASDETINNLERIASTRRGVANTFREAEAEAISARPAAAREAVEATGDVRLAADEQQALREGADAAEQGVQTRVGDEVARTQDEARSTARMVRDESGKQAQDMQSRIDAEGEQLRRIIQRETDVPDDMRTIEQIEQNIKDWGDEVMRGPQGLEKRMVRLPGRLFKQEVSGDRTAEVLRQMARSAPVGSARQKSLMEAAERAAGNKPIDLSISDIDSIRRAFNSMVDGNGVRIDMKAAADALRREASDKVKPYGRFLEQYRKLQEVAEGFKAGGAALGEDAAGFAINAAARSASGRAGVEKGAMAKINAALGSAPEPLRMASKILARRDALIDTMGEAGENIVRASEDALNRVRRYTDEINDIKEAARNTREGLSDSARTRVRQLRQDAANEVRDIRAQLNRNQIALRAADNILNESTGGFQSAISQADEAAPVGEVARGAIAERVGQSPSSAIRTLEALEDSDVTTRLAAAAGEETAEALQTLGRTQTRSARNLSRLSVRDPNAPGLGDEIGVAIDLAAGLTGRAGAGFVANAMKRRLNNVLGIGERAAEALARAVVRQDEAALREIITKLETSNRSRALIEQTVNQAVVALAGGTPPDLRE